MALSSKKNNIFKKVKDYVQKQDGLYPVSRDTSSDTVFMGNSNASNVNTLTTVVGDGNYTSGDNGEMAEGLYSDSLIPKITDNESFTSAMPKLTRIVNNVRYLVHALGTSDITQIGDGTLTGAISTLNSNYSKLGAVTRTDLGGTVSVPLGVFTVICIQYNLQPGTYLLIGMMSDRKDIQYTRLSRGNNADDIIANQPYGSRTLVTVATFTTVTTVSLWVYQNAESPMNFVQNEASILAIRIK